MYFPSTQLCWMQANHVLMKPKLQGSFSFNDLVPVVKHLKQNFCIQCTHGETCGVRYDMNAWAYCYWYQCQEQATCHQRCCLNTTAIIITVQAEPWRQLVRSQFYDPTDFAVFARHNTSLLNAKQLKALPYSRSNVFNSCTTSALS